MESIEDDFLGKLEWNIDFQEWQGFYKEEFGINVPLEYVDLPEVHQHIQGMVKLIERDELIFRQKAASDLYADGGYVLFWDENQAFDHAHFVSEMYLGIVTFEFDSTSTRSSITLWYEYSQESMEHGIVITLTWDGKYHYVQ